VLWLREGWGRDVQVVEGGCDVAHQCHEEDGDLEDVVLDKDETVDDLVVPGDMVKGEDGREEPEEDADAVGLGCQSWSKYPAVSEGLTGMAMRMRMAMPAATA